MPNWQKHYKHYIYVSVFTYMSLAVSTKTQSYQFTQACPYKVGKPISNQPTNQTSPNQSIYPSRQQTMKWRNNQAIKCSPELIRNMIWFNPTFCTFLASWSIVYNPWTEEWRQSFPVELAGLKSDGNKISHPSSIPCSHPLQHGNTGKL